MNTQDVKDYTDLAEASERWGEWYTDSSRNAIKKLRGALDFLSSEKIKEVMDLVAHIQNEEFAAGMSAERANTFRSLAEEALEEK